MTDRYHALTVVLDRDVRSDDAEWILNAIRMIKGVARVEPHVADVQAYHARARVGVEIGEELGKAVSAIVRGKNFTVTTE